jgi:hypothetical protein
MPGSIYGLTSLRIAQTSSNSELKSKEVVTRALHRKLRDRGFRTDTAYRERNIPSYVGRQPESRRIMESLTTGYDQRFWTLPIVCNWRRWARVRLHVALDLAVCTAVNIVSNSLERPGKDSLPTVSQSTSLGIGRQRPEGECGNDTRRPINPEQQNIYLYIELNISIFKQVADEFDGACQVLNGRGPQPLPVGCRLGADTTSVGCLPRVLHFRSARDTSAKVADRNLRRSVSPVCQEGPSVLL